MMGGRFAGRSNVGARIGRWDVAVVRSRDGNEVRIGRDGKTLQSFDVDVLLGRTPYSRGIVDGTPLMLDSKGRMVMDRAEVLALADYIRTYATVKASSNRAPESPRDVRTMDQLRDYVAAHEPWTAPYLADPEVWGWLCDYYAYVAWMENGNQPTLAEDATYGYLAQAVYDLVISPDPERTAYLTSNGDSTLITEREVSLLERRAEIQARYGIKKANRNRRRR